MNPTRLQRPFGRAKVCLARHRTRAERQAPERIRSAARWCVFSAVVSIFVGFAVRWDTPVFGGDAYTEMVERLSSLYGGVAWLAAVVLLVAAAVLRAMADILDELKMRNLDASEKESR